MADAGTENQSTAETRSALARRQPRKGRRKLVRMIVLIAVLIILAAGGYYAWKYFSTYESTDDAQVDGHINAISARINGYVLEVPVEDEQVVKAGDVLVRIDPKDYAVAVDNAQADVAAAEATSQSSRTDVPITSTTTDSSGSSPEAMPLARAFMRSRPDETARASAKSTEPSGVSAG